MFVCVVPLSLSPVVDILITSRMFLTRDKQYIYIYIYINRIGLYRVDFDLFHDVHVVHSLKCVPIYI